MRDLIAIQVLICRKVWCQSPGGLHVAQGKADFPGIFPASPLWAWPGARQGGQEGPGCLELTQLCLQATTEPLDSSLSPLVQQGCEASPLMRAIA